MKTATLAFVALMFASGHVRADQRKETETVDRTIAFSQGGKLKLNNFSGDVTITGTPGNEVIVHAVRRASRDRLDNIKLDISIKGSTIDIEANRRTPGWEDHN